MQEKFMKEALKQAQKAFELDEVPVGAIIVKNEKIIARAYNKKENHMNSTSHAEILAIQKASKKLKNWRLNDCELYVTLEPCIMCAGAILSSRIKKVYIGANDNRLGAVGSVTNVFKEYENIYRIEYEKGILKSNCESIIKDFFKKIRKKNGGKIVKE